jgi:hypothetical protein
MASLLRHIAQAPAHSPARAKFFLTLAETNTVVIYAPPVESVIESGAFNAAVTAGAYIPQYALLKDTGREIVVYDAATGLHTYKFRQVQIVNGANTEGVGADAGPYVQVWAANGSAGVTVVRTG